MTARTHTPDRTNPDGSTTIKVKRACNGCDQYLGDITDAEMERAIAGAPQQDVRAECDHCAPLVQLEAEGCTTWRLTLRNFHDTDRTLDNLGVFTKGYTRYVDSHLKLVGLRIGTKPGHVVARFGDWIVHHPDGGFTVHAAPCPAVPSAAADQTGQTR